MFLGKLPHVPRELPSVFIVPLSVMIPRIDPRGEWTARDWMVRTMACVATTIVAMREPKASVQRNHQQGMGGCYV